MTVQNNTDKLVEIHDKLKEYQKGYEELCKENYKLNKKFSAIQDDFKNYILEKLNII